jgi:hypothetical protein
LQARTGAKRPTVITAPPGDAPEFRRFDFWIGDWRVFEPDETLASKRTDRYVNTAAIALRAGVASMVDAEE